MGFQRKVARKDVISPSIVGMVTNRPAIPTRLAVGGVASVTQPNGNVPRGPFIEDFCPNTKQEPESEPEDVNFTWHPLLTCRCLSN